MLEIVYQPIALTEIDAIADYTKIEWGETQAKRYVEDLRKQVEVAAEFPRMGSATMGLPTEYRKLRSGSHRVIYRLTEKQLVFVRVLHEREDVPDDIENFLRNDT